MWSRALACIRAPLISFLAGNEVKTAAVAGDVDLPCMEWQHIPVKALGFIEDQHPVLYDLNVVDHKEAGVDQAAVFCRIDTSINRFYPVLDTL